MSATRDDEKHRHANDLCGDYVLKTDQFMDPTKIWSLYMVLLQAEEGFSCLKGTLDLRPNFHQIESRVEAHIFISVLAYHLLTWVRESLRACGDLRDWKTLRRLLSTHSLTTTTLPLSDGRILHIRKPSLPTPSKPSFKQSYTSTGSPPTNPSRPSRNPDAFVVPFGTTPRF